MTEFCQSQKTSCLQFTEGEDGDDGLGVMSIQLHREKKGTVLHL